MDSLDLLRDLSSRPRDAVGRLRDHLDPATLNAHVGDHPNSVAWLLWHTGREIDVQLAELSGQAEQWTRLGFRDRFELGEIGDSVGYGHTRSEARRIIVEDAELLVSYVEATLDAIDAHLSELSPDSLGKVIDEQWDPPVTRGARLVSILDDAIQHLAQAAYVVGTGTPRHP